MTGCFEIYIKRPKNGMVFITPPPPMEGHDKPIRLPDMKDSDKFDYELIDSVELPSEVYSKLTDWMLADADFCEEFIVRCELPV